MIAELYGKVSSTNSNLTERLEDELTGNFFGNMRYLPFNKWLKPVLANCLKSVELSGLVSWVDADEWNNNILFWERDKESEIDIVLLFDEIVIGIEVKYKTPPDFNDSGYGESIGNNNQDKTGTESNQQFIRESRTLLNIGGNRTKLLILLADEETSRHIDAGAVEKRLQIGVRFAHITWQDVLLELEKLVSENMPVSFESVIIGDIVALLKQKGFERFNSFELNKSINIDPALTWPFEYKIRNGFDFEVNKKVEGGLYYEFGKEYI